MTDFLVDTPVGALRKGDIIWYRREARRRRKLITDVEWAVVSGVSGLSPSVVFARNDKGAARAVHVNEITRIQGGRV